MDERIQRSPPLTFPAAPKAVRRGSLTYLYGGRRDTCFAQTARSLRRENAIRHIYP